MADILRRFQEQAHQRDYCRKHRAEVIDPPEKLNDRWFTSSGQPSPELHTKHLWLMENLRNLPDVKSRIGDYFTIVDILIIGGQTQSGCSNGDLDMYVWLKDTMRPLYLTSDERDLRNVIAAAINKLPPGMDLAQMMKAVGKPNFIDVYISTVKPKKSGQSTGAEIYYSFTLDRWIRFP